MAVNKLAVLLSLALNSIIFTSGFSLEGASSKKDECVPVTIKECKSLIGYDTTRPLDMYTSTSRNFKNGKKLIEQLSSATTQLDVALKYCAEDVIFLLCSVYSPICVKQIEKPILPCKGVCDRLKQNCGVFLNKYGIELPEELKCENLPEHNSDVCIQRSAVITTEQALQQSRNKNGTSDESNKKCDCNAHKFRKPRYKNFRRAHYVIEASITSRATLANGHSKIIVHVNKIIKSGKIQPILGKMRLWSPTSCLCQNVEYDVKYVIMGKENTKRLVIDNDAFILPYKEYESKVIKWKQKCEKRGKCPKTPIKSSEA